jgi:glycosyltransferase involved in cell wall biosynthesis
LLAALDGLHIEWKIVPYPWMGSVRPRHPLKRIIRTVKAALLAIPMARIIKQWQCDFVYSNTATISAGAFAARLARRPHIWHLHEFGYLDHNFMFDLGERQAVRLMDRLSAIVIANSHAVAEHYAHYLQPNKVRVIYQAVTLREEVQDLISDNHFFQCIMVGTLHACKGQKEAITAISELVRRGADAHLLVVGDGEKCFKTMLLQQVNEHCLEQRVKFYGYAENPARLITAADLMLVCSQKEAFGRVTVEGMLAGKALIGSASGGTTELIQDGKTGLLYQAGNHVELADKIQYLYENPEERSRLGTAARIWAEGRFTQDRYAKEVLGLLRKVLTNEEKI